MTPTTGQTVEQMIQAANHRPPWNVALVGFVAIIVICLVCMAVFVAIYAAGSWISDRSWNAYLRWTWRRLPESAIHAAGRSASLPPSRMVTNVQPIRRPYDQDADA